MGPGNDSGFDKKQSCADIESDYSSVDEMFQELKRVCSTLASRCLE